MIHYVLDACALIALLQNEQGAGIVVSAFSEASNGSAVITMNKTNLLEVYYDAYRFRGKDSADLMISAFRKTPVCVNAELSDRIFYEAGRLKATYRTSLADSFALAQAIVDNGRLLTSDHHEFDVIEGKEPIVFQWIR